MRAKTIMLMVAVGAALIACRTTKTATQTTAQAGGTARMDVREAISTTAAGASMLEVVSAVSVSDEVVERGSRTRWSAPDSSGRQHPVETERYTRARVTGTHGTSTGKRSAASTVANSDERSDKSSYSVLANGSRKEDIRERVSPPAGFSWGLVVLAAGAVAIAFVFIALKRRL